MKFTREHGQTWEAIAGSLPDESVEKLAVLNYIACWYPLHNLCDTIIADEYGDYLDISEADQETEEDIQRWL